MIDNRFFSKHHTRLVKEAVIKSALCGFAIGFAIDFLLALLSWLFDFGSIWLAIGAGLGTASLSGVLFYFYKFRPTPERIARRVDRLGLEERLTTMMELQNDDSYMAMLQRQDARAHLSEVEDCRLRIRIPKVMAALALVAFLFSTTMTTVLGLSKNDIIPAGGELFNPEDSMENYISITYEVDGEGEILGEANQLIAPGENGTPVVAEAEDGWMFVGWDDGTESPERQEFGVTEEIVYVAIFEEFGDGVEGSGGDSAGEAPDGEDGDQASDAPNNENGNSAEGEPGDAGSDSSGEGSEGKPNENDSDSKGESEDGGEGEGGQGSSGKWEDSNQFIDGKTYYRDMLEKYYEMAQEIFAADGSIPPELIELFESFFDSI